MQSQKVAEQEKCTDMNLFEDELEQEQIINEEAATASTFWPRGAHSDIGARA